MKHLLLISASDKFPSYLVPSNITVWYSWGSPACGGFQLFFCPLLLSRLKFFSMSMWHMLVAFSEFTNCPLAPINIPAAGECSAWLSGSHTGKLFARRPLNVNYRYQEKQSLFPKCILVNPYLCSYEKIRIPDHLLRSPDSPVMWEGILNW